MIRNLLLAQGKFTFSVHSKSLLDLVDFADVGTGQVLSLLAVNGVLRTHTFCMSVADKAHDLLLEEHLLLLLLWVLR